MQPKAKGQLLLREIKKFGNKKFYQIIYKTMKKLLAIFFILPVFALAQKGSLLSGTYSWKQPAPPAKNQISSAVLFEGLVHDFEWVQMSANSVAPVMKKNNYHVPANQEYLFFIKSGSLMISFHDSDFSIGAGSVAMLMPGEKYTLKNPGTGHCDFYIFKYRSKQPVDMERGKTNGGSFVKDWNKIEFKPHDKGGVRNYFVRKTAMGNRIDIHVTTLNEGLKSHDPHTHRAEEMVLMIDGDTEMQIGDKFYKGTVGTIFYMGSNVPHAIRNDGKGTATYFAFQFE